MQRGSETTEGRVPVEGSSRQQSAPGRVLSGRMTSVASDHSPGYSPPVALSSAEFDLPLSGRLVFGENTIQA